ncbi:MAG: ferrous iron transport protein A [Planctomycetales bacterium]|nr:ferrous iron transport protein A [Planctomycetales bacterium]
MNKNPPLAGQQRLDSAKPGETLWISDIEATGPDAVRLKRLGICEGRCVQVVQTGDPLVLLVVGCRIGISRQLASRVSVRCNTHLE